MDIYELEEAAHIVYIMCRNHPELCPHQYEWESSTTVNNVTTDQYRCRICGTVDKRVTK